MKFCHFVIRSLIFCAIFLASCLGTVTTPETKEPTMSSLYAIQTPLPITEIESWTHFKLPESASNVQTHALHWMDSRIYVKFQLPASELDAFLAEAGFTDLKPDYWPFHDGRVPWWPKRSEFVDNPEKVFAGQKIDLLDQKFSKSIGVDMTEKDVFTIYLICFDV